jgi:hypothetical protein
LVEGLLMGRIRGALEACKAFSEPRDGLGDNPFRLACTLSTPAGEDEIRACWQNGTLHDDLVELWTTAREARLFEDIDYGQWGLRILSPEDSARRTAEERKARAADLRASDVVIGEFLGDQELLIRTGGDEGILIALPLDGREFWYRAGENLGDFLDRYVTSVGRKFWESSP